MGQRLLSVASERTHFSSFDVEMVQPRFVGAGKQSERAQQAMRGYDARVAARVAIRTSKWQSASGFSRLQVTIEGMIEALKVFKGEVAESILFMSTRRKPRRYLIVAARRLPAAVICHRGLNRGA